MKKSTLFLLLALTLPALIYFLGLGGAISSWRQGNNTYTQGSSTANALPKMPDSRETSSSEFAIDEDFTFVASTIDLQLIFDASLKGKAEIAIISASEGEVQVESSAARLAVSGKSKKAEARVVVKLPTKFKSLQVNIGAIGGVVKGDINSESLEIKSSASQVKFDFGIVKVDNLDFAINGGEIDFRADSVLGRAFDLKFNAGEFTWSSKNLVFAEKGDRSFKVKLNAGDCSINLGKLASFALSATVQAGHLEFQHGNDDFTLSGIGKKKHLAGPAGAPELDFKVNAGSMEITIAD
jgi:hypothetical protein